MVRARRLDLGFASYEAFARSAGISVRTLGTTERGDRNPSDRTAAKLEKALGWATGSVDAVLRGGQPVLAAEDRRAPSTVLDEIRSASPQQLVRMRHMYAEFHGPEAADAWLAWAIGEQGRTDTPTAARPAAG